MPPEAEKYDLCIVVPVKNEAKTINLFLQKTTKCCIELGVSYEIVFVNDGSTDATFEVLIKAQEVYSTVTVINLSRSFGKEVALTAGIDYSNASAVIPMDVDLQDPPYLIKDLYRKYQEGFDVVVAVRADRSSDRKSKVFFAKAFHWLFKKTSDTPILSDAGDFRLMSERVVAVVKKMPERSRFMKGLLSWPGFKTAYVSYDRPERSNDKSKFSFIKLWNLALDGLFSFSTLPLRVWTYIGASLAIFSILYMIFTVVKTLVLGIDLPGYASLLSFMLLLGGINLIGIGVLGEYIGRIFIEVKGRPLYVVESVFHAKDKTSEH